MNVDSARGDLAGTFVNAGFWDNKLMVEAEEGNGWIYKNTDHGMPTPTRDITVSNTECRHDERCGEPTQPWPYLGTTFPLSAWLGVFRVRLSAILVCFSTWAPGRIRCNDQDSEGDRAMLSRSKLISLLRFVRLRTQETF